MRRVSSRVVVKVVSERDKPEGDAVDLSSQVPLFFTTVAALSVATAVARVWGLLIANDMRLIGLLSLQDILQNALGMLPAALLLWCVLIGWKYMPVLVPSAGHPLNNERLRQAYLITSILVLLVLGLGGAIFGAFAPSVDEGMALSILGLAGFMFLLALHSTWSRSRLAEFVAFAALVLGSFGWGLFDGTTTSNEPDFELTFGDKGDVQDIRLIVTSSDFFIGKLPDGRAVAIPRSGTKVTALETPKPHKPIIDLPLLFSWGASSQSASQRPPHSPSAMRSSTLRTRWYEPPAPSRSR